MTARPDEVVAWQYRYLHRSGARWMTCDEYEYNLAVASPHEYETRALTDASALQSANARLAAVLALADEWEGMAWEIWKGEQGAPHYEKGRSNTYRACADNLRRAAAGEGDAKPVQPTNIVLDGEDEENHHGN